MNSTSPSKTPPHLHALRRSESMPSKKLLKLEVAKEDKKPLIPDNDQFIKINSLKNINKELLVIQKDYHKLSKPSLFVKILRMSSQVGFTLAAVSFALFLWPTFSPLVSPPMVWGLIAGLGCRFFASLLDSQRHKQLESLTYCNLTHILSKLGSTLLNMLPSQEKRAVLPQ